jgi:predicted HAD superfamily Cof-like phosphohydrolase
VFSATLIGTKMNERSEGPSGDVLDAVTRFHVAMGLPVGLAPRALSPERLRTRAAWLMEELDELSSAQSLVQQVDATLDVLYLALGTLVELGVPLDDTFAAVHSANLRKVWPDGSSHTDEAGKLLKPPGWVGPEADLELILGICTGA